MKKSLFATLILLGMFSQNLAAEAVMVATTQSLNGLSASAGRYKLRLAKLEIQLQDAGNDKAARKIGREIRKVDKHQSVLRKVEETVAGSK